MHWSFPKLEGWRRRRGCVTGGELGGWDNGDGRGNNVGILCRLAGFTTLICGRKACPCLFIYLYQFVNRKRGGSCYCRYLYSSEEATTHRYAQEWRSRHLRHGNTGMSGELRNPIKGHQVICLVPIIPCFQPSIGLASQPLVNAYINIPLILTEGQGTHGQGLCRHHLLKDQALSQMANYYPAGTEINMSPFFFFFKYLFLCMLTLTFPVVSLVL